MYKAIKAFVDLMDDNRLYRAGDEFPRPGLKVSPERLNELLTDGNKRGTPLIETVKETKPKEKEAEIQTETTVKKPRTPRKKKNAE